MKLRKEEIVDFLEELMNGQNKADKEDIENVILLTELYLCDYPYEPCGHSICGECCESFN